MTCEDANSKVFEVVTVADVDADTCVEVSLVLKFGHQVKFLFRLGPQGLVKI